MQEPDLRIGMRNWIYYKKDLKVRRLKLVTGISQYMNQHETFFAPF